MERFRDMSRLVRVGKYLTRIGLRKSNPWFAHIALQDRLGKLADVKSSLDHLDFLYNAVKLNNQVKATQRLRSLHPGVRGGVKGSFPFHARYRPRCYPSRPACVVSEARSDGRRSQGAGEEIKS